MKRFLVLVTLVLLAWLYFFVYEKTNSTVDPSYKPTSELISDTIKNGTENNDNEPMDSDYLVYNDPSGLFSFSYPKDLYFETVPGFPNPVTITNISFFKDGEEADHSFGDHAGNEVAFVTLQKEDRTPEYMQKNYGGELIQFKGLTVIKRDKRSYLIFLPEGYLLILKGDIDVITTISWTLDFN